MSVSIEFKQPQGKSLLQKSLMSSRPLLEPEMRSEQETRISDLHASNLFFFLPLAALHSACIPCNPVLDDITDAAHCITTGSITHKTFFTFTPSQKLIPCDMTCFSKLFSDQTFQISLNDLILQHTGQGIYWHIAFIKLTFKDLVKFPNIPVGQMTSFR